jgi:hypothetical protein
MGRSKKKLRIDVDALNQVKDEVKSSKELEDSLDETNEHITQLMLYGRIPNLSELTWKNYKLFKQGRLDTTVKEDADMEAFFKYKKREISLRFITFLDMASAAILDENKMEKANLKELTSSLHQVMSIMSVILGKEATGRGSTIININDKNSDLEGRLERVKKELETVEAEYEEITRSTQNTSKSDTSF